VIRVPPSSCDALVWAGECENEWVSGGRDGAVVFADSANVSTDSPASNLVKATDDPAKTESPGALPALVLRMGGVAAGPLRSTRSGLDRQM
jgi:hypothetical protein